jgi:transcriptional regulator with XRE-family HTH domain
MFNDGKVAPVMADLPTQDELRRRLRAARALKELTVPELAQRIPPEAKLSLSTLRKIESGERDLNPAVLRELANWLGVPYAWFTVPDVGLAVGMSDETFEGRLAALETSQQALWAAVREGAPPRGAVRRSRPSTQGGRDV